MHTKPCTICEAEYPVNGDYFYRNARTSDGFRSRCKNCERPDIGKKLEYDPEWRSRKREYERVYIERKLKSWVETNGPLPTCECGCGTVVGWARKTGSPARFVKNHYYHTAECAETSAKTLREYHLHKFEDGDFIEIKKLRKAIRQIKANKGWTWKELADHGGLSFGHLRSMMSDKRVVSVRHDLAWGFFRRIAELPAPASTFQKRELAKDSMADAGMDRDVYTGPIPVNTHE